MSLCLAGEFPELGPLFCPSLPGFMPGRCTCDRILTLNLIAQRRREFGSPTYAAYVDLRSAFDSISRPALWLLLSRLGILARSSTS